MVVQYPNRAESFIVRGNGDDPNIVLERYDADMKATSARPASIEELLMYRNLTEIVGRYGSQLTTIDALETTLQEQHKEVEKLNGLLARAATLLEQAPNFFDDEFGEASADEAWLAERKQIMAHVRGAGA